jgi:hypothetical protein
MWYLHLVIFFMRVEPWNYNKQVSKVSKIINVYTYQMFKLWSNFNIKAKEAECVEKNERKFFFSSFHL